MNTNRTQHHLMLCCLLKHYFLRINPWKEKQEVDLVVRFSLCSSAQLLSNVQLSVTPWIVACQAFLSITNFWSLLKLMYIEVVMPSNHLILCRPLLLLPSTFPSIRVFSNESALCIRRLKYWNFSIRYLPPEKPVCRTRSNS